MAARRVLVVGGDSKNYRLIEESLRSWTFETVVCSTLPEARALVKKKAFALIFCEARFEGGRYADLLWPRSMSKTPVVVMLPDANQDDAFQEATELGAWDVLPVSCTKNDVQWMVIHAMQRGHHKAKSGLSAHSSLASDRGQ
jgi:DNA-binding NtrC family response regulator